MPSAEGTTSMLSMTVTMLMTVTTAMLMAMTMPKVSNLFGVCFNACSRIFHDGTTVVAEPLNPASLRNISLYEKYQAVQL